jgi:hypothetical protein
MPVTAVVVVPVLVVGIPVAVVGMITLPASGSRTNVRVTPANGLFQLLVL